MSFPLSLITAAEEYLNNNDRHINNDVDYLLVGKDYYKGHLIGMFMSVA